MSAKRSYRRSLSRLKPPWIMGRLLVWFYLNVLARPVFFYTRAPRRPPTRGVALLLLGLTLLSGLAINLRPAQTAAATSNTVNFQARLETSTGAIAADGNYNVEFKIYDASSSSGSSQGSCSGDTHCKWVEDYTYNSGAGSSDVRIKTVNGYLTADLGSVTAFSGISWDQKLWITMNIGGTAGSGTITWDGEMSPRLQLTAVPYAFSAGKLADPANSGATLTWAAQGAANSLLLPNEAGTICLQGSTNCSFAATTGGSGYIQNQNASPQSSANFNISGSGTLGGNLSVTGTYDTNTFSSSSLQFGAASTATLQSAASQALTITGNAASTWSTSAGALTIQSAGTTTLTLDTGGAGTVAIAPTHATTITVGATGVTQAVTIGSSTSTSTTTLQAGYSTTTSVGVIIGNPTADANQVNLQLDTSSGTSAGNGADAGTCSQTVNQGAMYYNQAATSDTTAGTNNTNAIRACIDATWQDVITSQMLGLQLFGVVIDSGPSPGDWIGINSTLANAGPCKVYMGSTTTSFRYTGCTVYSGGRKYIIPAQTTNQTITSFTNGNFIHICLTGTNGLPTASPGLGSSGTQNANLPTFSATAPILCLADIKESASAISGIYDTRTFSTTTKELVNNVSATPGLGMAVYQTSTAGQVNTTPASAGQGALRGVIVAATSGTQSNNVINTIIATAGPSYVAATAGTTGQDVESGATTAGYAVTTSSFPEPNVGYGSLGMAQSSFSSTCSATTDNCRGSLAVNISIR